MVAPNRRGRAIYEARQRRALAAGQLALGPELHEDAAAWTPDDWATPWPLVRELEAEFGAFELDPAAAPQNAKAPRYFTRADDGLQQPWAPARCWLNPPYSHLAAWIRKAVAEAAAGALVVAVLPVRTDRDWWHDLLMPHAEIRFQRGRQRFIGRDGTTIGRPWFAAAICIFRPLVGEVQPVPSCTRCRRPEHEAGGLRHYPSGDFCTACSAELLAGFAR